MADEKVLLALRRTEDFGSAGSRRVVRSGRIPAVVYGKKGVDPLYVTLDAKEFRMKREGYLRLPAELLLNQQHFRGMRTDMQ